MSTVNQLIWSGRGREGDSSCGLAEEIIAYTESLSTKDRYGAICDMLEGMIQFHDKAGQLIEGIFNYMVRNKTYAGHVSEEEFQRHWAEIRDIAALNAKKRDRRQETLDHIEKYWKDDESRTWVRQPGVSTALLETIRKVSRAIPFRAAVGKVNRAMVQRVKYPRRGVSNARHSTTRDWLAALKMDDSLAPPGPKELRLLGMGIGESGLACPLPEVMVIDHVDQEVASTTGTANVDMALLDRKGARHNTDASSEGLSGQVTDEINAIDEDEVQSQLLIPTGPLKINFSEPDSDSDTSTSDAKRAKPRACKCSSDVTRWWLEKVGRRRSSKVHEALALLEKWATFRYVCYTHTMATGGRLGLVINNLNRGQLRERLLEVYKHRLQIGKLKTDTATFKWFRRTNRPTRPSDSLGPYKLMPLATPKFDYNQEVLLSAFADKGLSERWERDGTVNTDLFSWWFETKIGDIVLSEFDMYHFHLREINGRRNWGWLRNMFYSIGQQLMRQDPLYYTLYAALRPDKNWRLVSYPYYAKYAKTGDTTYFRHIDINIPDLLATGRGSCLIQGSVSLDNEAEDNCTVVLPGMQKKLPEWWEKCVKRGAKPSAFVHGLNEQMYTAEDAKELGIYWTSVPCRRGEVRVTLPHIPHGSHGPTTATRRTMLPWFVGLQDDLSTLEVAEAGTWSQLRDAHMGLIAPPATPSGLANRYGAIRFRFPAAVEIRSLGALSDALVCRLPWDSPRVEKERDIWLGDNRARAHSHLLKWRKRAVATAHETMQLVYQREMDAFGDKSYFHHKLRYLRQGIPMPEISDDEYEDGDEGWGGDRAGEDSDLEFAEQGQDLRE